MTKSESVIIGAGPAGLACAYTLAKAGRHPLVLERDSDVGGLCRTIDFYGYLFDIGGHRFLSKSKEINDLWFAIMGSEMSKVRRLSRIYYRGKYIKYPLSFFDTFRRVGPAESCLFLASYFFGGAKSKTEDTYEKWVVNRFGRRCYTAFFKTYTEKVWGISCGEISSDWAKQRIRGLSLFEALHNALLGRGKNRPKTLSEEFFYPRRGPGEFYQRLKDNAVSRGAAIAPNTHVTGLRHDGNRIISISAVDPVSGVEDDIFVEHLFSSMPLPLVIKKMRPQPPESVVASAQQLRFRSFLVVNLILDKQDIFPDQWIYVHSPEVRLARIQNYKNWSPAMVLDSRKTTLGLEYFCTEGDTLWKMNDVDMINYALKELQTIGVTSREYLIDGFVIRRENVYPVYNIGYEKHVDIVRNYLRQFSNLQTMGRQGLFRYDNSDRALLTGIYAAHNYLGEQPCDIWELDADEGYLESKTSLKAR